MQYRAKRPGALLENVRFLSGEKADDNELAKRMAAACDVFVMDAFGTAHRAQASTHGIVQHAPEACAGLLAGRGAEGVSAGAGATGQTHGGNYHIGWCKGVDKVRGAGVIGKYCRQHYCRWRYCKYLYCCRRL